MSQEDTSSDHTDRERMLFAKRSDKLAPRELAIDQEISMAVDSWISGDMDEAVYLTSLAEYHLKMTNQDFEDNYDEEG